MRREILTLSFKKDKSIEEILKPTIKQPIKQPKQQPIKEQKQEQHLIIAKIFVKHCEFHKFEFPDHIDKKTHDSISIALWYLGYKLRWYYSPLKSIDEYLSKIIKKMLLIVKPEDPDYVYIHNRMNKISKKLLRLWICQSIKDIEKCNKDTLLLR